MSLSLSFIDWRCKEKWYFPFLLYSLYLLSAQWYFEQVWMSTNGRGGSKYSILLISLYRLEGAEQGPENELAFFISFPVLRVSLLCSETAYLKIESLTESSSFLVLPGKWASSSCLNGFFFLFFGSSLREVRVEGALEKPSAILPLLDEKTDPVSCPELRTVPAESGPRKKERIFWLDFRASLTRAGISKGRDSRNCCQITNFSQRNK